MKFPFSQDLFDSNDFFLGFKFFLALIPKALLYLGFDMNKGILNDGQLNTVLI
jgi:hypothetical protein